MELGTISIETEGGAVSKQDKQILHELIRKLRGDTCIYWRRHWVSKVNSGKLSNSQQYIVVFPITDHEILWLTDIGYPSWRSDSINKESKKWKTNFTKLQL